MAEENIVPKKIIVLNADAKKRILDAERDIPALEQSLDKLSELVDVTSLREKLEWSKKVVKVMKENFT